MPSYDLTGHVALVTGSAKGIGRATALLLAERGADVAVVDIDGAGALETAASIAALGQRAKAFTVDLSDPGAIRQSVEDVIDHFGFLTILVNNAGITTVEPLLEMSVETWDLQHAVNLRSQFVYIQGVARHMVERGKGGAIVNVSSSSAFRAQRSNAAYGSSKAGVLQLTRSASAELGSFGIRVNAVAPGVTNTPMTAPFFEAEESFNDAVRIGPLANLLHRFSAPEDVAEVIAFLASDASRQMTGQCLHTSAGAIV